MNSITLAGLVKSKPEFSHEIFGEKFYEFTLSSERESGTKDDIKCLISELGVGEAVVGKLVKLTGEVRTRTMRLVDKNALNIYVFVNGVMPYENRDENRVVLNGIICKSNECRETPKSRIICDLIVASNRARNHKSDYIPCIAWGRNAVRMSYMPIGTNIEIIGRLQSREYIKRYEDGNTETKVAYELSIMSAEVVDKERIEGESI